MAINITYLIHNNHEFLGAESHDQINEILIPDNTKDNTIITRSFENHSQTHRWLVKSIKLDNSNVTIYLEPKTINDEVFLLQTMTQKKLSAQQLLRFGTIVEVDFGFKPKSYTGLNEQKPANRYPDVIQSQELYKRRPAIVLKATNRGVQVIPLTSKEPDDFKTNGSIIKLSADSLKDCVTLNNKDSYALPHLTQTVYFSRILPPLSVQKSRRPQRLEAYRVRISQRDEKLLSSALANNVGFNDYYENKFNLKKITQKNTELESSLELLTIEKEEKSLENNKLTSHFNKLQKRYDTLFELLKDQYIRSETFTIDDVEHKIENEIEEFQ